MGTLPEAVRNTVLSRIASDMVCEGRHVAAQVERSGDPLRLVLRRRLLGGSRFGRGLREKEGGWFRPPSFIFRKRKQQKKTKR